ncbi:MAG: MarC family protein [Nitrospinota bacterium]
MADFARTFAFTFIPIFVAVDIIGVLPIFMGFAGSLAAEERKQVIRQSLLTAASLSLGFLFLGKAILVVLGVTIADFKVAGGIILLFFAILDILMPEKSRRRPSETMGVVPLGTPLIAGPAVLTTLLIMVDHNGYLPTIAALIANLLIVWLVLTRSESLTRFLGEGGSLAVSKVASLLLAAIAVMMIRLGVIELISGAG